MQVAHRDASDDGCRRLREFLARILDAPRIGAERLKRDHVVAGAAPAVQHAPAWYLRVPLNDAKTFCQIERCRGVATSGRDLWIRRRGCCCDRGHGEHTTRASAQSAWSYDGPSPASLTTSLSCEAPVRETDTGLDAPAPVKVGLVKRSTSSTYTWNTTLPRDPTSSSTPIVALNVRVEQDPLSG